MWGWSPDECGEILDVQTQGSGKARLSTQRSKVILTKRTKMARGSDASKNLNIK